jgi:hypothetical protein
MRVGLHIKLDAGIGQQIERNNEKYQSYALFKICKDIWKKTNQRPAPLWKFPLHYIAKLGDSKEMQAISYSNGNV